MQPEDILKQFELDEKEISVYLAGIKLGPTTAINISRLSGVARTLTYDVIERLQIKGLFKISRSNKKDLFTALSPEELFELFQQRLRRLENTLPLLKKMAFTSNKPPKVSFHEGKVGIDFVNNDCLKEKGELIGFTSPDYVKYRNKYISREFTKNRLGKERKARIIGEQSPEVIDLKRRDQEEKRETKIISPDNYSSKIELFMVGDKTYIADYQNESGVIINSPATTDSLRQIFEIIWRQADGLN